MSENFVVAMFGALFAVMNPFVNLPIFLGLTQENTKAEQRKTAISTIFFTAIACVIVAIAGSAILSFFGISVSAFRVAGGLVLMQIGFLMLNGSDSPAHHGSDGEKSGHADEQKIAFYPMTFPMLVGPGTMTTLILYAHKASSTADWVSYGFCVAGVLLILGAVLFFASNIDQLMSATMRTIMTRLMGMILAAIAVGMIAEGLLDLLPGLAQGSQAT